MVLQLLGASPAWADKPEAGRESATTNDSAPEGRSAYEDGVLLARNKEFLAAREKFLQALELPGVPLDAYYALGQVELALGLPCEALESYERYLAVGKRKIAAQQRERLERHMELLSSTAGKECAGVPASTQLHLECAVDTVEARLDNRAVPLPQSQPLDVAPGRHEIVFVNGEQRQGPIFIDLEPGGHGRISCGDFVGASVDRFSEPVRASRLTGGQKAAIGLMGAGVATGLASLSLYLWNLGRYQVWSRSAEYDAVKEGAPPSGRFEDVQDSIDQVEKVDIGLAIAAGVLTGAGVTLFVVETNRAKKNRSAFDGRSDADGDGVRSFLSAQLSPRGASLTWRGQW